MELQIQHLSNGGKQPKKNVARVVLEAGPACVWILSRLMLFLDSMEELLVKESFTSSAVLPTQSSALQCQERRYTLSVLLSKQHFYTSHINSKLASIFQVANILLAHAGRGGGRGVTEASAEIARTAARSWLAPLLDTACDRLAFVLGSLFEIALERNLNQNSECKNTILDFIKSHRSPASHEVSLIADEKKAENMDGYVGFHAALRNCYSRFVKNLAKQCKQLVRHHLDSVTSPYSMACYESDYHQGGAFGSYYKPNQASGIGSFCFELSDTGRDEPMKDQENIPPEKSKAQETTPGKGEETHITVPETPSPDQPCEIGYGLVKKEIGNGHHHDGGGARKRVARMGGNRNIQPLRIQNGEGGLLFGTTENGMKSSSAYTEICSSAAQHFARIREVLVERSVTSTLNSGFLTPW